MSALEKFFAGAFALIAVYLIFNAPNVSDVIGKFGSSSSDVFKTLQGR